MELFVNNAILHVLDTKCGQLTFSDQELDVDSDICADFIQKHIKRLMSNQSAKDATFSEESPVLARVLAFKSGETSFKDFSLFLAERLFEIMKDNSDVPSADLLIAQFERGDDAYVAILKLDLRECYTHQIAEDGSDNQIVKYCGVLPFDTGKVEEAALIPYDPMIVKLIEKPRVVGGESRYYFSELYLECLTELSKKEVAEAIEDAAVAVAADFYKGDPTVPALVKMAALEASTEAEGVLSVETVASRAFAENDGAKSAFVENIREAGVTSDIEMGRFAKSRWGKHNFKATNGIELRLPSDLTDDDGIIEFVHNEDGSVTITLKSLRFD